MTFQRYFGLMVLFIACCPYGGGQAFAQDGGRSENGWFPQILEREKSAIASEREKARRAPYLPDFSYAGYRWGEEPLPEYSPTDSKVKTISAAEFGAVPDDEEDDTEALREALAAAHNVEGPVLVRLPAGRLILKEILFIERSNIVLQGRGSDKDGTELYVPKPLRAMSLQELPERFESSRPNGISQFSWSGGVIWVRDPSTTDRRVLARLVAGRRGQHTIRANQTVGVQEGDVVEIEWYNRGGRDSSLLHHIYCTTDGLSFGKRLYEYPNDPVVEQKVTVEKVKGKTLTIKEPLLHDLRRDWTPTLTTANLLENVGIEHLKVAFPDEVGYRGHHNEPGYNGLYLTELLHSWVRDVVLTHTDSGILTKRAKNITITDVSVGKGRSGHYTIHMGVTYGGLVKNFRANDAIHNPSFNTLTQGSIYTDGLVIDPRLDQHTGANNQNLFDNLRTRYPDDNKQFVDNAGPRDWRPDAGAFNTLWNLEVGTQNASETPVSIQDVENAPFARVVGVHGSDKPIEWNYGPKSYMEGLNKPEIDVPSLYEYQLKQRLNEKSRPSFAIYNPLQGYRYEKGKSVQIAASIAGNFKADVVKFMANGVVIGTDTDGTDGWSVEWEAPSKGPYTLQAEATSPAGETLTARPQSCTGEDVNIWVGDQEGILEGNYPNPFHTETTIEYALAEPQYVRLQVYDTLGRRVKTLVKRLQSAGRKKVAFDGRGLASGVYFYRLNGENFNQTGKATVVR
ncbi:T9SS type A sorting domain-containing protein [Salinibacter sp.]|uniref:T9SS type A sorting domain-containing protein n=1 Tax=Salinibacter sp. TaxID=2065818 RepID=UPI0021E87EB8|nr:T9SS type A sorting domain-containing protein [Salinibacter sp.]